MSALDKIGIRVAPFSHRIVLARFGVDPNLALETKDATSEFFQAIAEYAFDGKMPSVGEAAEASFGGGDQQFIMLIRRVDPAIALAQADAKSGGGADA
ncbi:hypothetical protein [Neorhizobium sp. AL 9.2.2]|uniref:hypothetical protein n=1 Tax=Neorhizobium sp. AL 9.2.2 TaxID=2712894 RepID=UPI0015719DB8|nr:hypothetical protein [Neorhizobium sp. AL 9.2.2]NSY17224.1 hypothetical protein [Neorhizobium sp. AL 9.2.2]